MARKVQSPPSSNSIFMKSQTGPSNPMTLADQDTILASLLLTLSTIPRPVNTGNKIWGRRLSYCKSFQNYLYLHLCTWHLLIGIDNKHFDSTRIKYGIDFVHIYLYVFCIYMEAE